MTEQTVEEWANDEVSEEQEMFDLCLRTYLNGERIKLTTERDDGHPFGTYVESRSFYTWVMFDIHQARRIKNAARCAAKLL